MPWDAAPSRRRRVVGKAEYLSKGDNPRFVVLTLGNAAHRGCAAVTSSVILGCAS